MKYLHLFIAFVSIFGFTDVFARPHNQAGYIPYGIEDDYLDRPGNIEWWLIPYGLNRN